ncbi:axin-1 isoform X4 [Callithrix jacchus]
MKYTQTLNSCCGNSYHAAVPGSFLQGDPGMGPRAAPPAPSAVRSGSGVAVSKGAGCHGYHRVPRPVIWSLLQPIGGGSPSCSPESRFCLPATQWPRAGTCFLEWLKVLGQTSKPIMADSGMVGQEQAHGARQGRYPEELEAQGPCSGPRAWGHPPPRAKRRMDTDTAPRAWPSHSGSSAEPRYGSWREPVNPYYVNAGYALAPATSANDSEQQSLSSDADTLSLTDSSVDGMPPYRIRKQHRREMQESVQVNGRVPLPHIPRTYRVPKEVRVEPQKFAEELIHRLEAVQRTREAEEKLEERLKRVRMEEEGEDGDPSSGPPGPCHKLPLTATWYHFPPRCVDVGCAGLRDAHEENPESILDEHVQRVLRTPGRQSPGPGHRSPDSGHVAKMPVALGGAASGHGKHVPKSGAKLDAAGLHHHRHVHHHVHHSTARPKEQVEAEAARRAQSSFAWGLEPHIHGAKPRGYSESVGAAPNASDGLGHSGKVGMACKRNAKKAESGRNASTEVQGASEDTEKNQKIMQWIIEGEKEISRHRRAGHGSSGTRKPQSHENSRPLSLERSGTVHPWAGSQLRTSVQPSHLFIQDPTMPPHPAPNPLTQLEEARRRLEEEEKRASRAPSKQRARSQRKAGGGSTQACDSIVVAYYFCGEPIPYRTLVRGRAITLGQFKELLTKKGSYRYYFKKVSDEFDCGVVFEEVREDGAVLPVFEEKIIGKVEKVD